MGRKAKFDETNVSSGRGRKAKKQGDPTFPKGVLGMENYKFISLYQLQMHLLFYLKIKKKKKENILYNYYIFSERRKKIKSQTKTTRKKKIIKETKYKRKIKGITKKEK